MLSRAKFQLKVSTHLVCICAFVWLVISLCSLALFNGSWPVLVYVAATGLVTGRWVWRYAWLRSSTSVLAMSWTPDEFCCYLSNGHQVTGQLMAKSAFHPCFITLHIAVAGGGRFWWPLLADSGPEDALRKLRVFGRWHQQPPITKQNYPGLK